MEDIESSKIPAGLSEKIERHIPAGLSEKIERQFLMMERRIAESERQKEKSILSAEINLLRERNRKLEEEHKDDNHFAIMALLRR